MGDRKQIIHLDRQDHVGLGNDSRFALRLIQRMTRWKVHAPARIDDGALQCLGKLNHVRHAVGRSRHPVTDQHGIVGRHEHTGGLGQRAGIANRGYDPRQRGNAQPPAIWYRVLLQFGIEREQDRTHWRREGDFVSAYRRFGEMLERGRLVIPFDEIAHDHGRVDRGMRPLELLQALFRIDDIADDRVDRYPVAPCVVERHRGVLQSHGTVTDRGHGLAFYLGVALRHREGNLLVRAGDDLGPLVHAIVDDRFVQSAEVRRGVHRQIIEVERLEHVDHEIPATRALRDRVRHRGTRLGCLIGCRNFSWRWGRSRRL